MKTEKQFRCLKIGSQHLSDDSCMLAWLRFSVSSHIVCKQGFKGFSIESGAQSIELIPKQDIKLPLPQDIDAFHTKAHATLL